MIIHNQNRHIPIDAEIWYPRDAYILEEKNKV